MVRALRCPFITDIMITINDLKFRWPGQLHAQLNVEAFAMSAGHSVFLRGPSGSGKSTLLSLIAGINTADSGKLEVLDQSMAALSSSERDRFRANHIGYIFQQFNLLPYLSVLDNVTLPCRFSALRRSRIQQPLDKEAEQLLLALKLPKTCLTQPVTELSIGQQQRVAAARALIGQPELIIADEPTSALDTDTRNRFIELLLQRCHEYGATLLFVSHDQTLAQLFDRDVCLSDINKAASSGQEEAFEWQ